MNVVVVPHPYSRAFDEVAETIHCGLNQLAASGLLLPARAIVIGAHALPPNTRLNKDSIIYNFEQHGSPQLNEATLDLFRRHEVWDYSPSNVAWLAERGVSAKHVPIGFTPELCRIDRQHAHVGESLGNGLVYTPDIDVLFYGLVNDRRRKILDELRAAGLNVCDAYTHAGRAVYGAERDSLISRSKIVLNVHYYDTGIFEMVRCSYLLANAACVISEESEDVPCELTDVLPFVPYAVLADECVRFVRDWTAGERTALETRAHNAFRACNEAQILRRALTT